MRDKYTNNKNKMKNVPHSLSKEKSSKWQNLKSPKVDQIITWVKKETDKLDHQIDLHYKINIIDKSHT